jgi:dihydroorotase-like cyclic amidohydrolase
VPETHTPVQLTDVLDPFTGQRSDVTFDVSTPSGGSGRSVIDGSELWALPGLFDADAHLPVLGRGVRETDRWRALAGGVTSLNTAVSWQDVQSLDLDAVTAFFAATDFPRILPILSIADAPSSAEFANWLDKFGEQIRTTWAPMIKIYSNDPHFWTNLEAIWASGCRAAIYFYDEQSYREVLDSDGPVHFRHTISKSMADEVRARPNSSCQTSPHFLLELPPERPAELHVLPPVPGGGARTSLLTVLAEEVDLIASDHNAPILGNTGPGLEIQQHLLPALLTLVEQGALELATAIEKATSAAAAIFQPAARLADATIIVDPRSTGPVGLWPGQEARRAAFLGIPLSGTTVAVYEHGRGFFL